MTSQDSIANSLSTPVPPQRLLTLLDQNRIRVYVTVEFKNSNLKRRLAVSEKPDKNILDLKEKIESEHNVLYKNQDIEIVEILLNDMFQITKDYSIGEIIQNDQAIKAVAKFRGNHLEKVKQLSRFETMSLSSNMKASPSLIQPNIFEAIQKSAQNSTFIQFNPPENCENSLYQSFTNQDEQPLSQLSSSSVIISGYQGGTDAGKESHLGKRHLPKKVSMTIAKDQAQKKSAKPKKEAKHKAKQEDKKDAQLERQERTCSQPTGGNNQDPQATSQSLANTDSTAITSGAQKNEGQPPEQPKKKKAKPPKVNKIDSAKKDDSNPSEQKDAGEETKKDNYTSSLKDKLKNIKKGAVASAAPQNENETAAKKKEAKPKEPKERKSPAKKPKKEAKAIENAEKTEEKPKETAKVVACTLPKSKLAASLSKQHNDTAKEDGVATSSLSLKHKRFNPPGKLLSSIQQNNPCRRPTLVAQPADSKQEDEKMQLEEEEDELSKLDVNIQKNSALEAARQILDQREFESGISSPAIKSNLPPQSDSETTGKDSLNKIQDCSSGSLEEHVKESESNLQGQKIMSCAQEAGIGGVESEINPSQITTVPNIITNESE